MAASPVPVSGDWFGVERGHDAKIFTDPVQEEARHPQVVTHVYPFTRPNLELPLEGENHQFSQCFQKLQLGSSGFSLQPSLPERASLLRWCHKSGLQHKDRLYSEPPQYLYHRPYQLPHRSSRVLKDTKQTIESTGGKSNRNQQLRKQNLEAICTLWSRKAIRRPTKWVAVCAQDGIFLLHTKPGMLVLHHLHHLLTRNSKIGFCRRSKKNQ